MTADCSQHLTTAAGEDRAELMTMRSVVGVVALALLAGGVGAQARVIPAAGAAESTHDPSMARDGKTWYVFATGKAPEGEQFAVRCSEDLKTWRRSGQVFADLPQWIKSKSPKTTEMWAPDVQRVAGEYRTYHAYSLFGKNTSGIRLAVTKTLDPASPKYGWVDKGLVLESKATDTFNAIDPARLSRMGRGMAGWRLAASGMASRCAGWMMASR